MTDQRSVLKEFRHLDEKLRTVGLSPSEESRWRELRDLVAPEDAPPIAPGFDVNAAAEALKASLEPAGLRSHAEAPPEVEPPPIEEQAEPQDATVQAYAPDVQPAVQVEGQPYAEAAEPQVEDQPYAQAAEPAVEGQPQYAEVEPFVETQPAHAEAAQTYGEPAPAAPPEIADIDLGAWDPNAFPGAIDAAAYAQTALPGAAEGQGEGFPEVPGGTPLDASALPPVEAAPPDEALGAGEGRDAWDSLTPPNVADAPPVPIEGGADGSAVPREAPSQGHAEAATPEPLEAVPEAEPVDLDDLVIEDMEAIDATEVPEEPEAPEPSTAAAPPVPPPAAVPAAPPQRAALTPPPTLAPAVPPAAAPPARPRAASTVPGSHRVVIHTVEGQVKRGALTDVELDAPQIPLEAQPGGRLEAIPASRIKAIFFMLGPGDAPPAPEGKKVRVTFRDGRQVAGYSPDYDPDLSGFFMLPVDTRTNTGRIWVYRAAVRDVSVS